MAKKQTKKKSTSKQSASKQKKPATKKPIKKGKVKVKLHPGKKQCKNCSDVMPIHQRVCPNCGHFHQMKKKKEDIMKNLNKMTPIVIKSIIENDDFNQFLPWNEHHIYQVGEINKIDEDSNEKEKSEKSEKAPKLRGRRSSKEPQLNSKFTRQRSIQADNNSQVGGKNSTKRTNMPNFQYTKSNNPINCVASSKQILLYVQQIQKQAKQLTQNQRLTIKAYSLQHLHCFGVQYEGQSLLKFTQNGQQTFDEIKIPKYHIVKAKIFCNLVALLTGKATLLIFSLPLGAIRKTKNQSLRYELQNFTQIIEPNPDKITSFQFLRGTALTQNDDGICIVIGTAFGHLSIYKIKGDQYRILRYIPNAHRQMITCISQCPLNSRGQGILFSSGCYDGSVSIWDLQQKNKIYCFQASNRKIWSITWDLGAKYILISRDDFFQSTIIACFYSINKIQTTVHLANQMEIRTIKNQKYRCVILQAYSQLFQHDFYSKYVASVDPVRGYFKMVSLQELRGNSLKKKKPKKQQSTQKIYHIQTIQSTQSVSIKQVGDDTTNLHDHPDNGDKKFPIYSDICIQNRDNADVVYLATYDGFLIRYQANKQ